MTNREAISKLVSAGLVKFPEPETRSVQAIKHSNNRRLPAPKRDPNPPPSPVFPENVFAIADANKREKYRVPLRGPNYREPRYIIYSKDLQK